MPQAWNYDPDAGVKFIGKVIFAREMTAGEFDQRRDATLSAKVGADQGIFYLEVENLESRTPGTTRAAFFLPDDAPVSKWSRFKKALKAINVSIKRNPDGTTSLEGHYFVVEEKEVSSGKYGKSNTMELVEIPTPEDVDALEKARAVMMGAVSPDSSIATTILAVADGLTEAQMKEQMDALNMGVWEPIYAELKAKQSITVTAEGVLRVV